MPNRGPLQPIASHEDVLDLELHRAVGRAPGSGVEPSWRTQRAGLELTRRHISLGEPRRRPLSAQHACVR
jgi:hypothetical protein